MWLAELCCLSFEASVASKEFDSASRTKAWLAKTFFSASKRCAMPRFKICAGVDRQTLTARRWPPKHVLASFGSTINPHIVQTSIHVTIFVERFERRLQKTQNVLSFAPTKKLSIKEWNGLLQRLVQRRYWTLAILGSSRLKFRNRNCMLLLQDELVLLFPLCIGTFLENSNAKFAKKLFPFILPHPKWLCSVNARKTFTETNRCLTVWFHFHRLCDTLPKHKFCAEVFKDL